VGNGTQLQTQSKMKEHTLKELADIGADAAFANNKGGHYMSVSKKFHSWDADEPARQAFAQAVRDAVIKDLVTNLVSLPTEPVLVPLDIDDIRATDEFRHKESLVIETVDHWNCGEVGLAWSDTPTYAELAANYLRRQHGSNEWKPCTKEAK